MKKRINDLLLKMQTGENCVGETANQLESAIYNELYDFAEYLDELQGEEDFAVNEIDNFLNSKKMTVVEELIKKIEENTALHDPLRMEILADQQIWLEKEQRQLKQGMKPKREILEKIKEIESDIRHFEYLEEKNSSDFGPEINSLKDQIWVLEWTLK